MPRFRFRFHDGLDVPDVSVELPDVPIARRTAVKVAADCLRDHHGGFEQGGEWAMEVADEAGRLVCALRFTASDIPASDLR